MAAWLGLAVGYALLFWIFSGSSVGSAAQRALINTVPAILLGLMVAKVTDTYLFERTVVFQGVAHLVMAPLFGILWYVAIQAGYGLRGGWMTEGLVPRPLLGVALTWQAFQGLAVYAAIVGFIYAANFRLMLTDANNRIEQLETLQAEATKRPVDQGAKLTQIMVKDGRALRPVSLSDILVLSGAGDYTEVITAQDRHLSNTSLSDFERELPEAEFARVHRSHIIRKEAIHSVESGGNGRLTLHFANGVSITTSRAGAQKVKAFAL